MTWKGELPTPTEIRTAPKRSKALRVFAALTWLLVFVAAIWVAAFAGHLFSEPPPGCTPAEFLRIVWQQFTPGFVGIGLALLASGSIWLALWRVRKGVA